MTLTILLVLVLGFALWFWKKGLVKLAEHWGSQALEAILFPNGQEDRDFIMHRLQVITKNKYNDVLLLDYFLKIKGLQVVDVQKPLNFWTRKYLMSPTKLRLNYFEQVKFYEGFLNYPAASMKATPKANRKKEYITSESEESFYYKKRKLA
ncbi:MULTISPECIES: hypothetical protein [unclassified Carboxylicivirga]|uniref:hypothetical protein n=1 Tax=Carboxylicivirga TaxID=1628153 RepID=UPI003D33C83E